MSPGNCHPVFDHPQSKKKNVIIYKSLNQISCTSICACCLISSLGVTENSLSPSFILITIIPLSIYAEDSPMKFLFFRLNHPSSLNMSSQERCFSSLVAFCWAVSDISTSLLYWEVHDWTQHLRCLTMSPQERGSTPSACRQCCSKHSPGGCLL